MPLVDVEITVRVDGVPTQPYVRRINPTEANTRKIVLPHGNPTTYFILSTLGTVNGWIIQSDQPINIRLNNQGTVSQIPLNGGGILLLLDAAMTAGANVNVLANNPSNTLDATLTILEVGP